MLEDPEFEPEFYEQQIKKMEERYSILFKKWRENWNAYYKYVTGKLRHNQYWIWIYLCGFEKFVQEEGQTKNRKIKLYQDADARIARIIGDYFKIQEYIKSL